MTKHSTNPRTRKTQATHRSIGIDLGDRFSELCVLDGEGALVSQARLPQPAQRCKSTSARKRQRESPLRRERIPGG